MILRKYLCISVFCVFSLGLFLSDAGAQSRERVAENPQGQAQQKTLPQVIKQTSSRPTTPPRTINRPTLTDNIVVVSGKQPQPPLVKKTGSSNPINMAAAATTKSNIIYGATSTSMMLRSIQSKLGIPYIYGSSGPNSYDCSGFIWSVFKDAGFLFERSSARTFWNDFEPVSGDDRYKFGTLVFFNQLGHAGIVADETGFYHASSSKGITYSKFEGYWEKRIVGFRRIPLSYMRSLTAK